MAGKSSYYYYSSNLVAIEFSRLACFMVPLVYVRFWFVSGVLMVIKWLRAAILSRCCSEENANGMNWASEERNISGMS